MAKMYKCNCGNEAIHIERLDWLGLNEIDEIMFSIWYNGSDQKWAFRELLRHCWQVLRKGKPYPDQICLYPVDALELAEDLKALAEEAGEQNRNNMENKVVNKQEEVK